MAGPHEARDRQHAVVRVQRLHADLAGIAPGLKEDVVEEDAAARLRVERPHLDQCVVVERGVPDPVAHAGGGDQLEDLRLEAGIEHLAALDLDVELEPGRLQEREHFGEGRKRHESLFREAAVEVELPQLGKGLVAQKALPVAQTVELEIMEHDRHTVGAELHIQLDAVGAERNGPGKGGQRVLRRLLAGAAMSPDLRHHGRVSFPEPVAGVQSQAAIWSLTRPAACMKA